jgi:TolB protein
MKRFTRHALYYTLALLSGLSLTGMLALGGNSQPVERLSPQSIAQQQSSAQSRSDWQLFNNSTYRISLGYPKNWKDATTDGFSGTDGFRGSNGFLKLGAMNAESLQAGCESNAQHRLQPFGSNPQVQQLRVQRQPACLILPSADQVPDANGMAALIVRYPQPVRINNDFYRFFVLWADKTHIRDLAATLRFMPKTSN